MPYKLFNNVYKTAIYCIPADKLDPKHLLLAIAVKCYSQFFGVAYVACPVSPSALPKLPKQF